MFEDFFYDFNWVGFAIAYVLLALIPIWLLSFFPMGLAKKLLFTVIMFFVVMFAVKSGGLKRGIFTK